MISGEQRNKLGDRAEEVFDRLFSGREDVLHPEDHAEAEAFWQFLGELERPSTSPDLRTFRWRRPMAVTIGALVALAACLLAVINVAGLGSFGRHAPTFQRFASRHAERRTVQLADGSIIRLAATSVVEVAFDKQERRVRLLQGEALFDVVHDARLPFVVQVANGEIRDVGTSFNVRAGVNTATVTVVDGVVNVSVGTAGQEAANGEGALTKVAIRGEQVTFGSRGRGSGAAGFIASEAKANVEAATAWTRGLIYFNGEPLSEAISTVNSYSHDQLILTDRRQADTPVFGVLNQGDPAALRELMAHPEVLRLDPKE